MTCLEPGCAKAPSHPMMLYCAEHNAEQVQMAHDGGFHDWCQHQARRVMRETESGDASSSLVANEES